MRASASQGPPTTHHTHTLTPSCPSPRWLQGEYVPETKIKLRRGDIVLVTGLLDTIRLNYLR